MMQLRNVKKKYTKDAHQSKHPEETIMLAESQLAKLDKGTFFGLDRVDHLDSMGLPVYRVSCNDRINEWGKGASVEQCKASAIMERVERYSAHAKNHNQINFIRSSFNNLKEKSISRKKFGLTNLQYILYGENQIDSQEMDWVQTTSLISDEIILAPAQLVYFRYPKKEFEDFVCTTGLAAGNTIEEAIQQALCEVVERHFLHVIRYNRPSTKSIDLSSVQNPSLKKTINTLQEKKFNILANVVSSDFGVHTVATFVYKDVDTIPSNTHIGTAVDPEIALLRAITETAQTRSVRKWRGHVNNTEKPFLDISDETKEDFELLNKANNTISMEQLSHNYNSNVGEELREILNKVKSSGNDALVKDLTHSTLQIPVVRVLIPGLQPNFIMHGLHHTDKSAAVTKHLNVFEEVQELCEKRQLPNQKIDEIQQIQ